MGKERKHKKAKKNKNDEDLDVDSVPLPKLSEEDMTFLCKNTNYSKPEIESWHKRFIQDCPNGVLGKADLQAMLKKISPEEDPTMIINHLFRIFDEDNSGTIEFKEFVMATNITTSGAPEEKLKWTFKMYDKDGSGEIDLSEMCEILQTLYVMEGETDTNMARIRAKEIFEQLDVNNDGTLTCNEFIQGCMENEDMVSMLKKSCPPTSHN